MRIYLDDGTVLVGQLAADLDLESARQLVGRVLDLKGAYKQLASHPADQALSIVAVFCPDSNTVLLFRALALMFGATAAVYAFLRVSRALARLATGLLGLVVVEFFDDFTQLELSCLAKSLHSSFERMLELLGRIISIGGKTLGVF